MTSGPLTIVVAVKYVPDAAAERRLRADDFTVDRDAGTGRCSELDEYAVEAALALVAAAGSGSVTALTIGPPAAADALKKALQMGADAGVHVSDEAIAGSDAAGTSRILAAAVTTLAARAPVDLLLCGMASTDGAMSVVPAMVAERLDWAQATLAHEVALDERVLTTVRDGESATVTTSAQLPAVVSVTDQANQPRYPSLKSIMAARKKTVTTWSLRDIGVPPQDVGLAASWTTVLAATRRPPRSAGRRVEDDGTGGTQLVDFLVEQRAV